MNIDRKAIIIGGSLSGLFTGVLLRSNSWQVDIYERSNHSLSSRGHSACPKGRREAGLL